MSTLLLAWCITAAQILLGLAMACAAWRLLRGPRAQDRVLGLDTLYANAMLLLVTMTRAGIDLLWTPAERPASHLAITEAMPIALLLGLCLALVVQAGPVMRYMEDTAQALAMPHVYSDAVLSAPRTGRTVATP